MNDVTIARSRLRAAGTGRRISKGLGTAALAVACGALLFSGCGSRCPPLQHRGGGPSPHRPELLLLQADSGGGTSQTPGTSGSNPDSTGGTGAAGASGARGLGIRQPNRLLCCAGRGAQHRPGGQRNPWLLDRVRRLDHQFGQRRDVQRRHWSRLLGCPADHRRLAGLRQRTRRAQRTSRAHLDRGRRGRPLHQRHRRRAGGDSGPRHRLRRQPCPVDGQRQRVLPPAAGHSGDRW